MKESTKKAHSIAANRLLNITDPKELDAALDSLTDEQFQQYKKALQKSNGLFYVKSSFRYIKRRHRAYLWMFRMRKSVDYSKGVYCEIRYKIAFGKYFLLHEFVKEYEIEDKQ